LDFSQDILPQMMEVLYLKKIQSLMVEGGSMLLQSFIDAGYWDEAYIEHSSDHLAKGVKAPALPRFCDFLTEIHFGKEFRYTFNKASGHENQPE
jgi:diaminohydroxyphosphoribosylaminopyrimidine deaminase/5-amino-6-(5-phosphoribosylamino)uracil reductase